MLFDTGQRWDKNTAGIHAILKHSGGYWDFQALAVSTTITPACKFNLDELEDGSEQSWYLGTLPVPSGGPYAINICLADGTKIGDDITPRPSVAMPPVVSGKTLTRDQFAVKVLSMLGVYDRSTPDAEDVGNVLDAYDAVYQELKDEGLVTWVQYGEEEGIPLRFLTALSTLVASSPILLATYPQTAAKTQLMILAGSAAEKKIRRQLASVQGTEQTIVEYF